MAVNDTTATDQAQSTPTPAPDLSAILAKLAKLEQTVAGLQPVKGDAVRLPVRQEPPPRVPDLNSTPPPPVRVAPEPATVIPPPRFSIIPNQRLFTDSDIRRIVREEIPVTLRRVDDNRVGNFLKLTPADDSGNATAYWGPSESGLNAKGDKVLNHVLALREYDAAGAIVAPGSDIDPSAYGTQALYEAALVAAGHTLQWTIDVVRWI